MDSDSIKIRLVGIDWGTTNLRAWAFDNDGNIVATRNSQEGILNVADGNFEATLMRLVGDWIAGNEQIPLIASGMITSRQGWVEIDYLRSPVAVSELVNQNVSRRLECGNPVLFISGVSHTDASGMPDVMRGEETQIAGLLEQESGSQASVKLPLTVVLPGTHSKWVYVDEQKQIAQFKTFMTGEVFALLSQHSILRHSVEQPTVDSADGQEATEFDGDAFERGIDSISEADGQILNRIFHIRTLSLSARLGPAQASEYLSGMLIGSELHEGLIKTNARTESLHNIVLVGDGALVKRYARAFSHFGCSFQTAQADTTARGLWLQYQSVSLSKSET